jgi:hypothetical protein
MFDRLTCPMHLTFSTTIATKAQEDYACEIRKSEEFEKKLSSSIIAEHSAQSVSFIHLHRRLYLSMFDPMRSSIVALHELNRKFVIVPYNLGSNPSLRQQAEIMEKGQVSLAEIYTFDCMMRAVARQNPNSKLVICAGAHSIVRARTVLLLGCHMILSLGVTLDNTQRTFAPLRNLPGCPIPEETPGDDEGNMWSGELTAANCWEAVATAKSHRWIDFDRPFAVGAEVLCVEEYLHYAEYVPIHGPLFSTMLSTQPLIALDIATQQSLAPNTDLLRSATAPRSHAISVSSMSISFLHVYGLQS